MSSGLVQSIIAAVLDDPEFTISSPRADNTKQLAKKLLKEIVDDDDKMDKFDGFSATRTA